MKQIYLDNVNRGIDEFTAKVLRTYLDFPKDEPILSIDLNATDGKFMDTLTSKAVDNGGRYMFANTTDYYDYLNITRANKFHKIFNVPYKSEAKMSKEVFSLGIIDASIDYSLFNQIFNDVNVDMFVEPDYEARARKALEMNTDELNLADDGLSEEEIQEREKEHQERLQEEIKNSKKAFRAAVRVQEQKLALIRDDQFLLSRITDRLKPGGILVMVTPKEMIDQHITVRLCNQYEDIMILRPESDTYLEQRKCIIIGRKRSKNAKDKAQGILLAETKFKTYKEIQEVEMQVEPKYKVPSAKIEEVEMFRIGPLTGQEIMEAMKKSSLLENFQNKYSQTMTEQAPVAPATLKKGHVMMLLTSGYLHGYIGEGANKHLVKGSATKLSRTQEETDDDGVTSWKEKEFYSISVKYLTRDGEFHRLI